MAPAAIKLRSPVLSDLTNGVHPIFAPGNFVALPGEVYDALRPTLQLATHLLLARPLLPFWHAVFFGRREPLRAGQCAPEHLAHVRRMVRPNGEAPLGAKQEAEVRLRLDALARLVTFHESPAHGFGATAFAARGGFMCCPEPARLLAPGSSELHARNPAAVGSCVHVPPVALRRAAALIDADYADFLDDMFGYAHREWAAVQMARLELAAGLLHELAHAAIYTVDGRRGWQGGWEGEGRGEGGEAGEDEGGGEWEDEEVGDWEEEEGDWEGEGSGGDREGEGRHRCDAENFFEDVPIAETGYAWEIWAFGGTLSLNYLYDYWDPPPSDPWEEEYERYGEMTLACAPFPLDPWYGTEGPAVPMRLDQGLEIPEEGAGKVREVYPSQVSRLFEQSFWDYVASTDDREALQLDQGWSCRFPWGPRPKIDLFPLW